MNCENTTDFESKETSYSIKLKLSKVPLIQLSSTFIFKLNVDVNFVLNDGLLQFVFIRRDCDPSYCFNFQVILEISEKARCRQQSGPTMMS